MYNCMLENNVSEQASRMSAMENSTKNAGEMLGKVGGWEGGGWGCGGGREMLGKVRVRGVVVCGARGRARGSCAPLTAPPPPPHALAALSTRPAHAPPPHALAALPTLPPPPPRSLPRS